MVERIFDSNRWVFQLRRSAWWELDSERIGVASYMGHWGKCPPRLLTIYFFFSYRNFTAPQSLTWTEHVDMNQSVMKQQCQEVSSECCQLRNQDGSRFLTTEKRVVAFHQVAPPCIKQLMNVKTTGMLWCLEQRGIKVRQKLFKLVQLFYIGQNIAADAVYDDIALASRLSGLSKWSVCHRPAGCPSMLYHT